MSTIVGPPASAETPENNTISASSAASFARAPAIWNAGKAINTVESLANAMIGTLPKRSASHPPVTDMARLDSPMATVAIAAWEGDIDRQRAHAVLNGTHSPEDEPLREADAHAGDTAESPAAVQPAN